MIHEFIIPVVSQMNRRTIENRSYPLGNFWVGSLLENAIVQFLKKNAGQ